MCSRGTVKQCCTHSHTQSHTHTHTLKLPRIHTHNHNHTNIHKPTVTYMNQPALPPSLALTHLHSLSSPLTCTHPPSLLLLTPHLYSPSCTPSPHPSPSPPLGPVPLWPGRSYRGTRWRHPGGLDGCQRGAGVHSEGPLCGQEHSYRSAEAQTVKRRAGWGGVGWEGGIGWRM